MVRRAGGNGKSCLFCDDPDAPRRDQYAVEFGWIGGRFASLIIVPPQTAIKGAGQISQEVAAHLDQGALRRLLALHP
jgi:hypothetical protein